MVADNAPKKSLGQHWLHDEAALKAMIAAADVQADDVVLEVGPGLGTLTAKLLEADARVWAVEFDETLVEPLREQFKVYKGQLTVEHADILRFDLAMLPPRYKVVANIPYYLTSNLIRRLCESNNPFSLAALLVQKEVAERVAAAPGNTSVLSITTQFYCQVGLGPVVSAKLFTPPPKVDSQILLLERRQKPLFKDVDVNQFFRLAKAGFSERRKKLRSSLSGGLRLSKEEADGLLEAAGIDGSLRAQNLSLEQWHKLYKVWVA